MRHARFLVTVYDYTNDFAIFSLDSDLMGGLPGILPSDGRIVCMTGPIRLTPGRCRVELELLKGETCCDGIEYADYFDVEAYDIYGSGRIPSRSWATCLLQQTWSVVGA